jgi:stalled ribosome rescue protein Dom34
MKYNNGFNMIRLEICRKGDSYKGVGTRKRVNDRSETRVEKTNLQISLKIENIHTNSHDETMRSTKIKGKI